MFFEITEKFDDLKISSALGNPGKAEIICISYGKDLHYICLDSIEILSFCFYNEYSFAKSETRKQAYCIAIYSNVCESSIIIDADCVTYEKAMEFFKKLRSTWLLYKKETSVHALAGFGLPSEES